MSAGNSPPRRALGRGLDALLPPPAPPAPAPRAAARYGEGAVFSCPIERLVPQPAQPRRRASEPGLDTLAESLRQHGMIVPIVVRRTAPGEDRFEIIAGERRWRAAQRAGLKELAVVVKDVSPDRAFELALVENLQREELGPIEVAEAYGRLMRDHGYSHRTLGDRVGKSRAVITNALRLLRLPAEVRARVVDGTLREGHARALLGAPDDASLREIAERTMRARLPVRAVEELVRAAKRKAQGRGADGVAAGPRSPAVRELELRLARRLGTRSEVLPRGGAGRLVVHYSSLDELDRILEVIGA